ncbi:pyruvate kinase alpha/beta domain-containing protein [Neomoorella humiferrea]|uniref:Pyruvate kinase, alpha/beta domain n=1 Tax=Neomoorella humiferrea TaxID=676965 RepID=A0A2T0ASA2_9FIRM|nr:pyruvate kinase alpha/beta domain-containing protein [Moorella humiferrea]PRR72917.1 Pyruvate kinase, alpha/beta domain [Moorella humiferrea]
MTTYWQEKGKINTEGTVKLALERARQLGLKDVVVASATGYSALQCLGNNDLNIVCVTHQAGFKNPGEIEMGEEIRRRLLDGGIKILTTTHLLAGLDRALRFAFQGIYPAEIIANTLRLFGQGTKVAVEVASMALDAGLIPAGVDVVAMGGSNEGVDTALVMRPAHSQDFFATKIKEIICKPREF